MIFAGVYVWAAALLTDEEEGHGLLWLPLGEEQGNGKTDPPGRHALLHASWSLHGNHWTTHEKCTKHYPRPQAPHSFSTLHKSWVEPGMRLQSTFQLRNVHQHCHPRTNTCLLGADLCNSWCCIPQTPHTHDEAVYLLARGVHCAQGRHGPWHVLPLPRNCKLQVTVHAVINLHFHSW